MADDFLRLARAMKDPHQTPRLKGGLAQYFAEHREVGWMALLAVLIWGWWSYSRLPQQEDPKIPDRSALLVTRFPGASSLKIEQLVTTKLEEKLNELESVEELKSQSRDGVSVITVLQHPSNRQRLDQEWDRLRAKLNEVVLPEGCQTPTLDTEFGNTVTLLLAVTSPLATEAELLARAHLIRTRLAELRERSGTAGRAAVFACFPPAISAAYQTVVKEKFQAFLAAQQLGDDIHTRQGPSFILADFKTATDRAHLEDAVLRFARTLSGTEVQLHPDFSRPVVLLGDEDPLPGLRATATPRYSYRELERMADGLEDDLRQLPSVGRVRQIGNVPEVIHLLFSLAAINGYQLSPDDVVQALAARNAVIPGGAFSAEGQTFPVQLTGEFASENDLLGAIAGVVGEGRLPVYARDLFEVRRGYADPIPFCVEVLRRSSDGEALQSRRAVLVAVEMKEGNVIGDFNRAVQATLARSKPRLQDGVEILTLSDQPRAVAKRIDHFTKCFAEAVVIVVLVALLLMEGRSALLVASAIPLTVALTLGGMSLFHVPLHQISISALIIALGMLVDDPVVAADAINREIAHGHPRALAAWLGPFKLRRAIFFATVINILAFLPLLLLPGDKGAFISGLPIVVTLALVSSRIVSMTFVPLLGYYWLRGQQGLEAGGEVRTFFLFKPIDRLLVAALPRYARLLRLALQHPGRTVAFAYGGLALSFGLVPFFGTQYFPPAERNQLLIDVQLPESASITHTRQVCRDIVRVLGRHDRIASAAVFSGGTAPRFYYNVVPGEPGSSLAQVLVNTYTDADVPPLLVNLREQLDQEIAGARCLVKQLEQGPPVETPIQVRLSGDDLDVLRRQADAVADTLRRAGGYKVHDDLGRRMPTLQLDIDQERANTLAINNAQIGHLAQAAFHGLKVTELREGDHLIPVVVRLRAEDRSEAEKIRTLYVRSLHGQLVPVNNFATLTLKPEYATIAHFNSRRAVTVKAFASFGALPSQVLRRARPQLEQLDLPPGYRLEFAGEDKELNQMKGEMSYVMAVSLGLITLAMVIQFNSILKPLVVMLTVPLGLIGAFFGVTAFRTSFGFMASLGIVSLAGIIVSHIIVLSDFIEEARSEGMELKEALLRAGLVRLRPVLVTVLATVGGLIPLALTGGELWRPLTGVHIFGLLFATTLTLGLLPVLYYLFCARLKWIE